jgi:probable O-glycosylation ligase (exosortase A-associated)
VRTALMSLVIPWLVNNEKLLRRLMIVMAFSLGIVAAKFGLFGLIHGGIQLTKGYRGLIADSNGLALAMAMLVPICWYTRELVPQLWAKLALLFLAGCALSAVIFTHSRGNAIALAAVLLMIALRSKYKLLTFAGLTVLVLPAILLFGEQFYARMATLQDVEGDASAFSRIVFAKVALKMAGDYPLFGVGFGESNYVILSPNYGLEADNVRKVHNTYLQTLVDSGVPGLFLFVLVLFGTIVWLQFSVRSIRRVRPDLAGVPMALQTALIAYAIGSTFYSRGDFELLYMVLMCAAAWHAVQKSILAAPVAAAPPAPSVLPASMRRHAGVGAFSRNAGPTVSPSRILTGRRLTR